MNSIIVDDNKLERTALKKLLSDVSFITIKQECSSSIEAFNYLEKEPVDLVFLDIEMPGMTGIELVKNLEKRPIVILITAKKDYAVEAFELNIADYIIKPITLSRLMVAVSRAKELFESRDHKLELTEKDKEYIFVRSNSILTKIKINEILYLQALGDYVNIHTSSIRYTVHITLRGIEEKLPPGKFYRQHRSYTVALDHIDNIEDNIAYINKNPIPIGEQFKQTLLKKLNLI